MHNKRNLESGSQCGCLRISASTGARDPKKDFTGLGVVAWYAFFTRNGIPEMATLVSSTGMDVGRSIAPVCHDYAPPFVFDGELRSVTFDIAAARKAVVARISE